MTLTSTKIREYLEQEKRMSKALMSLREVLKPPGMTRRELVQKQKEVIALHRENCCAYLEGLVFDMSHGFAPEIPTEMWDNYLHYSRMAQMFHAKYIHEYVIS